MMNQYPTGTIDTKSQKSTVKMSLEAKNRPIGEQSVQESHPADATHRSTTVKESATKPFSTGY